MKRAFSQSVVGDIHGKNVETSHWNSQIWSQTQHDNGIDWSAFKWYYKPYQQSINKYENLRLMITLTEWITHLFSFVLCILFPLNV